MTDDIFQTTPCSCPDFEGLEMPWTTGPLWRPPFTYNEPSHIGIQVGDSSVRTLVTSAAARSLVVRDGTNGDREVWNYSVPGGTAVHSASEYKVSTFKRFWDDHANCKTRFFLYFVPAKDSVNSNWGSSKRAKKVDQLLWDVIQAGHAAQLATVKSVFERLSITMDDAFVSGDTLHMTPAATKQITRAYFEDIARDQHQRGTLNTHVPIVVWDFNTTIKSINDDWETHKSFWDHMGAWAAAEGDDKRGARDVLSRALDGAVEAGPGFYDWREKSFPPDPVQDTVDTESDAPWAPGLLASGTTTLGVIVGSKMEADKVAEARGCWPNNLLEDFWRAAITGFMKAAKVNSVAPEAVEVLCKAVEGEHRALFLALQQTASDDTQPSIWYSAASKANAPSGDPHRDTNRGG